MAKQSVGTPRFFIDYTQLAKVKGFYFDRTQLAENQGIIPGEGFRTANADGLSDNRAKKNTNVWDFDYANPTRYTVGNDGGNEEIKAHFKFSFGFWNPNDNWNTQIPAVAKLVHGINYVAVINHDLASSFKYDATGDENLNVGAYIWSGGFNNHSGDPSQDISWGASNESGSISESQIPFTELSGGANPSSPADTISKNGYTVKILRNALGSSSSLPSAEPYHYSTFVVDFDMYSQVTDDGNASQGKDFNIGAITFGKYIDLPVSPDLKVTKSVEFDGVSVQRGLGGGDFVNINNDGSPAWLRGQPWSLSRKDSNNAGNPILNMKIGRNGRRRWDMSFSYISNDDLFYDHKEPLSFGSMQYNNNDEEWVFSGRSELQQLWDLTLGGALPFLFTPDKDGEGGDTDEIEYCVCRLDQDSFEARQVAYQTWSVTLSVVEVW
tara:strand:+ start:11058 stop:12371 length:1314 start_codon:yes stop_codon:yes gene_type:complete